MCQLDLSIIIIICNQYILNIINYIQFDIELQNHSKNYKSIQKSDKI